MNRIPQKLLRAFLRQGEGFFILWPTTFIRALLAAQPAGNLNHIFIGTSLRRI